jgi:hypothetical protein
VGLPAVPSDTGTYHIVPLMLASDTRVTAGQLTQVTVTANVKLGSVLRQLLEHNLFIFTMAKIISMALW